MPTIQEDISIKPYNTFGIEVKAKLFAEINNESDLKALFQEPVVEQNKVLVLGGGSNMLFTQNYEGLVIRMHIPGISHEIQGEEVTVTAGAGVIWTDLVQYCVKRGFGGMENLSLIPGTVGASPIQNIGAYGVELKDVFLSCRAFERATGNIRLFNYEDCKFDYRESVFKRELKGKYIITKVSFKLSTRPKINITYGAIQAELGKRQITNPTISDISNLVSEIRVNKLPDPSTIGNAGSFFKNPIIARSKYVELVAAYPDIVNYPVADDKVKLAAGWLIEQCGFKGKKVGETGTWKDQALVLVNYGNASGQEVYGFSEKIIDSVRTKYGVVLEREVNIL